MTDYTELVKALREAPDDWYDADLHRDAAAAIEELQAEVLKYHDAFGRLSKTAVELEQRIVELKAVLKEADKKQEYQHDCICELTAENEELKAEVKRLEPKRGEWIDAADEYDMQLRRHMYICSICGKHADSFVGGTEDWWTSRKPNYCPNCGAKMEVQNER